MNMEFQFGKLSLHFLLMCFLVMCTCSVLRTHCFRVEDINEEVNKRINNVLSLLLESTELSIRRTEHEQLTSDQESLDREKRFPRVPFKPCSSNNDCAPSHCCAMKFGVQTCRARPNTRQKCSRSDPLGTDQLFSLCPCQEGLKCKKMKSNPSNRICVNPGR